MSVALILQAPAGPNPLLSQLPLFLIMGLMFYFLIIRPQSKSRKEMAARLAKLKSGDEVVLSSGFYATVDRVEDQAIWIKLGDKTLVKAKKSAVVALAGEPAAQK